MPRSLDYAAEFRERAEELRSLAALMKDKHRREMLLQCASDYEKMAAQHERATKQGGTFKPPWSGLRSSLGRGKCCYKS